MPAPFRPDPGQVWVTGPGWDAVCTSLRLGMSGGSHVRLTRRRARAKVNEASCPNGRLLDLDAGTRGARLRRPNRMQAEARWCGSDSTAGGSSSIFWVSHPDAEHCARPAALPTPPRRKRRRAGRATRRRSSSGFARPWLVVAWRCEVPALLGCASWLRLVRNSKNLERSMQP